MAETLDILETSEIPPDRLLDGSNARLKEVFFSLGPPVLFGEKYRDFLSNSDRVDVLLNANLVEIETDSDTGAVAAFVYKGYESDAQGRKAVADAYVLALGGIENARILLSESRRQPNFLGSAMDHVGRYFMEHPHYVIGYYVRQSEHAAFGDERRFVAPTAQWMGEKGIANTGIRFFPDTQPAEVSSMNKIKAEVRELLCANDIVNDFLQSIRNFRCRPIFNAGILGVASEQVPNRNSYITLSDETDRFGMNRVQLNWQLTPFDKETVRVAAMEVAAYFARQDIGRVKLFRWLLDETDGFPNPSDGEEIVGHHHMGTTRMGTTEKDSVVDRNCRVFGTRNLYIAGSSVFRTSGHANPTFAIIQLTLRLADHLARRGA
ncbi:MAG: GMC family oxidoreductase [Alphaproteobacteria bacterium]|nr:GMC family oxidoreductase [Alphaproteobacteria bacterium]